VVNGPLRSKFKFGKNTTMADGTSVTADTVKIGSGSSVDDVFTNNLRPSFDATIRGTVSPVTLPVIDPFCTLPEFTCGTEDVIVPIGATQLGLAPGAYGRLNVGDGATLLLPELGTYTFCSIKIGRFAQVKSPQQITINVTGKFQMGQASFLGTTTGAPLILNSSGPLIRVSQDAVLNAAVTAPFAKFKIQRDGTLRGCLCSERFSTDKHVTLLCEGGSPSGAFVD
jgi:hypothetical protein